MADDLEKIDPEARKEQVKKRNETSTKVREYAKFYALQLVVANNFCLVLALFLAYKCGQRSMNDILRGIDGYLIDQLMYLVISIFLAIASKNITKENIFSPSKLIGDSLKNTFNTEQK